MRHLPSGRGSGWTGAGRAGAGVGFGVATGAGVDGTGADAVLPGTGYGAPGSGAAAVAFEGGSATVRIGDLVSQIGRASCRERVCEYGEIAVVDVSLKQQEIVPIPTVRHT